MDYEGFCAYLAGLGLSSSTVEQYGALWLTLVDYCAEHGETDDVHQLVAADVRAWSTSAGVLGRSAMSKRRTMVDHWCRASGQPELGQLVPVRREPHQPQRSLSDHDLGKLLDVARDDGGRRGLAVLVGVFTAARRSEVASLAWPRIDLVDGWVTLERRKVNDLHRVPLHHELARHLRRYQPDGRPWSWAEHGTPWVFPGERNGAHVSPRTVSRWVDELAELAGVACSTHQLRHSALTAINDRTGDLRAAQAFAGHSSPAVTARYTRAAEDTLRSSVDALGW